MSADSTASACTYCISGGAGGNNLTTYDKTTRTRATQTPRLTSRHACNTCLLRRRHSRRLRYPQAYFGFQLPSSYTTCEGGRKCSQRDTSPEAGSAQDRSIARSVEVKLLERILDRCERILDRCDQESQLEDQPEVQSARGDKGALPQARLFLPCAGCHSRSSACEALPANCTESGRSASSRGQGRRKAQGRGCGQE